LDFLKRLLVWGKKKKKECRIKEAGPCTEKREKVAFRPKKVANVENCSKGSADRKSTIGKYESEICKNSNTIQWRRKSFACRRGEKRGKGTRGAHTRFSK